MKYASFIIIAFATLIVACESSQQKPAKASQSNAGAKIKPTKTANKVTIADVEHGIREYIDRQTAAADGYLDIQKDTFDLHLKLVRVHTEYLSVLSPNEFFACVDLATASGDVYDVDFFLQGSKDSMTVTRTDVHKLNGRPYYTWKQRPDKTWYTVPVARSSNRLLGVIEGTDRFTFTYEVQLPEINGTAAIWLPVAGSDQYQTIEIISRQFPDNYQIIKDKEYNNSIFYAKLGPADSRSKIILQYRVTRHEKAPYPDPEGQVTRYLAANSLLPVNTRFRTLAADIIAKRQAASDLEKARALYDYVSDNLRYAKQGTYGTGDANYACDAKSGNCTEFHSLFISLARSAGIPARFAVGAAIPANRNEGGVDGYHCWAEFYAEGKWWPVDISEANKYAALSTYYFGHHPANRIEFSRGRDIAPNPLPASGPINFLAYPVFELNGQPQQVKTRFTFNRITDQDS